MIAALTYFIVSFSLDPYVVVSVPAIRKTIEGKVVKKNLNPKVSSLAFYSILALILTNNLHHNDNDTQIVE